MPLLQNPAFLRESAQEVLRCAAFVRAADPALEARLLARATELIETAARILESQRLAQH